MSPQFVFTGRFLVTDPNNALCIRPYRLTNISQLAKLKVKLTVKGTLPLAVYFLPYKKEKNTFLSWNSTHIHENFIAIRTKD
jgi:hypothetical protein